MEASAKSQDGAARFKIDINKVATISINGEVLAQKKIKLLGHHHELYVTNTGDRLLIIDEYAGFLLLDSKLNLIKKMTRAEILAAINVGAVNKWTCHPDGAWMNSIVEFDQQRATMVIGKWRKYDLSLKNGALTRRPLSLENVGVNLMPMIANFSLLTGNSIVPIVWYWMLSIQKSERSS